MKPDFIRRTKVYRNYFWDFYNEQTDAVKDKIDYVIAIVRTERKIPKSFFEHMEGTEGIYEIKVKVGNNIFRIFCCFDEDNLSFFLMASKRRLRKHRRMN